MNERNPKELFEFIHNGGWAWFVTLRYERHPDDGSDPGSVQGCFEMWIGWIEQNHGGGNGVNYVVAIERKANGDCLLHVLLDDIPEEVRWHWRMEWRTVGGRGAWDRELDDRVEGLFRFFYYTLNYKIITSAHGIEAEYRRKEGPYDYFLWEGSDVEHSANR